MLIWVPSVDDRTIGWVLSSGHPPEMPCALVSLLCIKADVWAAQLGGATVSIPAHQKLRLFLWVSILTK